MKRSLLALLVFCLVACQPAERGPPLIVLASEKLDERITKLLDDYTADTGIPLSIEWGDSATHADRLIAKTGAPADILLADNAIDIWRAADEGALRPLESTVLEQLLPAWKDPDGMWAAIDQWPYLLVYPPGEPPPEPGLVGLANPALKDRVCLTSSRLAANRALLGFLIEDLGVRPAERLARGWTRNLRVPPFGSQQELLDALRAGQCDYGILVDRANPDGLLAAVSDPRFSHIHAVGVARHAAQPERAQAFADWLLGRGVQGHFETPPLNAGVAGWRAEEARLLAERAGYR